MSTEVDITDYVAGDALDIDFTVTQSDGSVFPSLSTCTIEWRLDFVSPLGPGANYLTKDLDGGVTLVDEEAGTVSVSIETDEIEPLGSLLHSLIVTTADGDKYTVAKGEFVAQAALS